ncbi:MAG: glycosyltransferase [Oculatellaceae cyanobacterium bins.114]|nr:glycosyltransferase [Oculatellaceae cyanobacterium bins.114]
MKSLNPHQTDFGRSPKTLHRVLVVSPHFPPVNAPDHQRIRTALPYLQEFGWETHILAVHPDQVPHPQDPNLAKLLPAHVPVTRTPALPARYTQRFGLGNVGWRCLPYFAKAGDRLLAQGGFDLVFFSTTIFPVMTLGRRWLHRFGIPYVLDFQDPWRSDYQHKLGTQPPGGQLKYRMTQLLANICEPRAMRRVDQVISVSPAYPRTLQSHYPWLQDEQFTVLPFGAPESDFRQLASLNIQQTLFNPKDGKRHWVYVGRGGSDMAIALRALFLAIRQVCECHPNLRQIIHLHFVGTSYAPPHLTVKTIEPIAHDCGIADLVTEHPSRIPYFEAQQVLVDSDAILLIGSDDPSYTASKLYPCILAQKPILAVVHEQSSVVDIMRHCQAGQVITFNTTTGTDHLVRSLLPHIQTLAISPEMQPQTNWDAFQPYTAREMTRKLCAVFDRSFVNHG